MDNLTSAQKLQVFLCHSSGDKAHVRRLYQRLLADGLDPWLDEEKLKPGHDWELEIKRAVKKSDIIIVCLSKSSVNKRGFVQKEIKYALNVADEQPEGAIFLIPLKLEDCDVPERLGDKHWVDYYKPDGYERLMSALKTRAQELEIPVSPEELISPVLKRRIAQTLVERFSVEELEILCFDIGFPAEQVNWRLALSAIAADIVTVAHDRGMLLDLINEAMRIRPGCDDLKEIAEQVPS